MVPVGAALVRFSPLPKRETQRKSCTQRQVRIQSVIPVSLQAVRRASPLAILVNPLAIRVSPLAIRVSPPAIRVFLAPDPVLFLAVFFPVQQATKSLIGFFPVGLWA
jgi:hypothetical protein